MNILNNALNHISTIAPLQQIILQTFEIQNMFGMSKEVLTKEVSLFSHIQPITPFEIKKYTDFTLDSNKTFKFFFSDDNAKIIHSFDNILANSYLVWLEKKYKIYAIRDWYIQNGWVAAYGTLNEVLNDN